MRVAAVAFAVFMASGLLVAQQPPSPATGTFQSTDISFDIGGAIAFNGRSSLNSTEAAIIVVISNEGMKASGLADFVDRKLAVEKLIKDDKTAVVYFEFTPEGRYHGLSYYFKSGNGCGFCTSEVASTVKLANGRLTGKLKGTEKGRPFDVTLDVAIMSDDHGAALPADGGAPGKAYLAYHAALVKHDSTALKPVLSPHNVGVWDRSKKDDTLDEFLNHLAEDHPVKSVKITKGWATADKAALLIEGVERFGVNLVGEVSLVNTKGVWGVDEELVAVK